MSTNYPGDSSDALFMRDGPSPWWWLSPDLGIGGLDAQLGTVADVPGDNDFYVRVWLNNNLTFTQSQARVDLYLANPDVSMTLIAAAFKLGSVLINKSAFPTGTGRNVIRSETVTLPLPRPSGTAIKATDPDQAGHRCIIARVYPNGTAAPPTNFTVPVEQHEAQLNISVVKVSGFAAGTMAGAGGGMTGTAEGEPLGPDEGGLWNFLIETSVANPDETPEIVTLVATAGAEVPRPVLRLPALRRVGFNGTVSPARTVALNFDLPREQLPDEEWKQGEEGELVSVPLEEPWQPKLYDAKQTTIGPSIIDQLIGILPGFLSKPIRDLPFLRPKQPRFAVQAELIPRRVARFALQADMSSTKPGEAQVFHIEQTNADGRPSGGITVIMVKT